MLFEELGRALYHGPYFATIGLTLPALPPELRAEVAAGETSWTLAFGPLVPDLDTAERVAIVGGDGIYELEGGEREVLATTDASRPLGVVRGGEPGRRLADSSVLAEIEARSQTALALEACGVARLALEDAHRVRLVARAVRQEDRRLPGRLPPARGRVHARRALALARALGRVVRRDRRPAGGDRRVGREGLRRRERGLGLRDGDPVPRRHRLHLGAPTAPPVQARARDRELRRVGHAPARRDRGLAARAASYPATEAQTPVAPTRKEARSSWTA